MSEHDSFQWRNGQFTNPSGGLRFSTSLFDIVGFLLSLGLVFMGYSYGKDIAARSSVNSYAKPDYNFSLETLTPTISPTDIPLPTTTVSSENIVTENELEPESRCWDGYQYTRSSSYSFCLPHEFVDSSTEGLPGEQYTAPDQQFIVYTNSSFKFPVHICTFEQATTVAGHTATRSVFREETGGGCGEIIGFATRIVASEENIYLIRLFRTSGTYENEGYYQAIEQSFAF